ncbi:hypothetical protein PHJA_000424500 [Phtheirospermum japonicum]|uniref:Uncharacterized protein n=1 Tax=Phtheirospermum japonicum TaxID=374723 RepID=A0A830BDE0_9LAMI|nr:hypothetical protein PHJA_000424500 [Phtheirospermum japonicum]
MTEEPTGRDENRRKMTTTSGRGWRRRIRWRMKVVEEFFAVLKRTQVSVNYFRWRDGVRSTDGDLTSIPSWRPTFR